MTHLMVLVLWVVVASGYAYRRRRIIHREKAARAVEQALVPEEGPSVGVYGIATGASAIGSAGIHGVGAPGRAGVSVKSGLLWYQRLWRLVANPFSYLVRGEIRW